MSLKETAEERLSSRGYAARDPSKVDRSESRAKVFKKKPLGSSFSVCFFPFCFGWARRDGTMWRWREAIDVPWKPIVERPQKFRGSNEAFSDRTIVSIVPTIATSILHETTGGPGEWILDPTIAFILRDEPIVRRDETISDSKNATGVLRVTIVRP